jgi:hypothetical protein
MYTLVRRYLLILILFQSTYIISQSTGDIAFTGFNSDGDDDLAFVTFSNILPNTIIYFTDRESDGFGGLTTGEGTLIWNSGSRIIKAGTVIIFSDVDNGSNPNFGASIGALEETGSFSLPTSSKDGIIVFKGTDANTPVTFITAIQIGNNISVLGPYDSDGITLSNTGLKVGSSIMVFDDSATPDGAHYNASRSNLTSFSDYFAQISDDSTNWINIINGDGESLLPFSQEAFVTNVTNWTGATDSNWGIASNWDNGIPSSSSSVVIPNLTVSPIINAEAEIEVGNLTIDLGAFLTLNANSTLTVSGLLSTNDGLSMKSGSSLIANGTSNGNITYNRNLETSNWYLISSPVIGQDIDDFVATELLQQNLPNIALGTAYNTTDDTWSYYQNGTANSDTFTEGIGYSVNLNDTSGDISFTGSINLSDKSIPLAITGNGFNLIGNPYPSYINSASILTANTDALLTETIWIWDQSANSGTGGYVTKVTADNFQIAPAQGFFVQSDHSAGSISINEDFQSHQSTDTFLRTTRPEVYLTISDGSNIRDTKIYYIAGTTTGFDNGYDGPMFGGVPNSFAIYTHAVANGAGRNLAIQSLPDDFENLIVPVGVNAISGTEITISASTINIPAGINLYLEDKENDTFTLLNNTTDYTTTLTSNLNGIGRFYLHTTSQVLSINEVSLNNISIYTSSNNNLRIVGVQNETAEIKLYNLLGKQILTTSFQGNGVNDISIPNLRTGIYIIQLETETGKLNKKVIIE